MGVGGVESKLSVQLISPKLNNFNIVIIMPDIGNDFNFNHKPFIINYNCLSIYISHPLCAAVIQTHYGTGFKNKIHSYGTRHRHPAANFSFVVQGT